MGTRKGSRKLQQIAAHPAATLHFSDDEHAADLSLKGRPKAAIDPAPEAAQSHYQPRPR